MPLTSRIVLRWWHWLLIIVGFLLVLVLTLALALRSHGQGELAAVDAQARQRGAMTTLDDYLALAPSVAAGAQDDWLAWTRLAHDFPGYAPDEQRGWDRWVCGRGEVPAARAARAAALRPRFQPALDLLRRHDLVLGAYGWIAADRQAVRDGTALPRLQDVASARSLGQWLHHDAVLAPDPSSVQVALADLARLHQALGRQPGTLHDAMVALIVAVIRDRTYLDLALRGTLPAAAAEAWLAEPGHHLEWIAAGLDGDRVLIGAGLRRELEHSPLSCEPYRALGYGAHGRWQDPVLGTIVWTTGHHDCALLFGLEEHLAGRLRHERTDPLPSRSRAYDRMWSLGRLLLPDAFQCLEFALESEAKQRMMRIAVRLVLAHGPLPGDAAELAQRLGGDDLLAPAGDHLHLHYERLADDRFRLAIAVTTPLPDFSDPGRAPYRSASAGRPASSEPLVLDLGLELQLPALLPAP